MKTPTNTNNHIGISALLLACTVLLLSCGGCRSSKVQEQVNNPLPINTEPDTSVEDTTSQVWQDQHYYRGTKLPLPDSLKTREGLGIRFWYTLPDRSYKAIVFDDAGDPKTEVTQIHFVDSISKTTTYSLAVYEHNPYKELPYTRISGDRLMKVDGIIRYDLKGKSNEELRPLLMSMGVNIDTVISKIVGAEVMTGNNSPEERTALANAYAIQVVDEDGKIIANQTTYKIYDKYGRQTGEIKENGHGLYQFAITRDGKHLAASFGGRYGCRSGQYITPYFKIFNTSDGKVIHREDMEFSNGVAATYNYFTLVIGKPFDKYDMKIFGIDHKIVSSGVIPLLGKQDWKPNSIIVNGKEIMFTDTSYFSTQPFSIEK